MAEYPKYENFDLDQPRVRIDHRLPKETIEATGAATYPAYMILARHTSGTLQPFVAGGADGLGTPVAMTLKEMEFTGAGTQVADVVNGGLFHRDLVVKFGDATPLTPAQVDALHRMNMDVVSSTDFSEYYPGGQ